MRLRALGLPRESPACPQVCESLWERGPSCEAWKETASFHPDAQLLESSPCFREGWLLQVLACPAEEHSGHSATPQPGEGQVREGPSGGEPRPQPSSASLTPASPREQIGHSWAPGDGWEGGSGDGRGGTRGEAVGRLVQRHGAMAAGGGSRVSTAGSWLLWALSGREAGLGSEQSPGGKSSLARSSLAWPPGEGCSWRPTEPAA